MILDLRNILCLVSKGHSMPPALEQARHLARRHGASLHVLPNGLEKGPTPHRAELRRMIRALRSHDSEGSVSLAPADQGEATGGLDAILQYVSDTDIDLVIFDTPADRGPVPALAARPVGALIERLDRPMLVIGDPVAPSTPQRILVPTDFSDHSVEALRHARGLASLYGATVDLLHVMNRSPYVALTPKDQLSLSGPTLPEHRAYRRLQQIVRRGERDEVPIDPHLRFGRPADQIARYVTQKDIDLLVLSSHGTQAHLHHSFGRVSDRVLRRVTCSVFLIPSFGRSLLPRRLGREARQGKMGM